MPEGGREEEKTRGREVTPGLQPLCQRCGFPVVTRAQGCKNPCPNCGTVYPLGDCSD